MQQFDDNEPPQRPPHLEDPELAHAVSLSLKVCFCFLFILLLLLLVSIVCHLT